MSFGLPKMSTFYFEHIFQHIMVFVYGLLHTFRVGSVYVTLAVTFERFHAIICPLRHFKWKKYMLPFCIFFAVVYNIPKYFELKYVVSTSFFSFASQYLRLELVGIFWRDLVRKLHNCLQFMVILANRCKTHKGPTW